MNKVLEYANDIAYYAEQSIFGDFPAAVTVGLLIISLLLVLLVRQRDTIFRLRKRESDQRIEHLSELLSANIKMKELMKVATGSGLEMNERFLQRTGADLHDGPAQLLGFALLRIQGIIDHQTSDKIEQDWQAVNSAVKDALDEIRSISTGLVLPELAEFTLVETLENAINRHTSISSGIQIEPYYRGLPDQLVMPLKICAYRFVQEGLNNANRHGAATKCHVQGWLKNDVLHLAVKDNGKGFRPSQRDESFEHLGLVGLKERITSLGGNFKISSELGVGTRIKMSLPII